MNFSVLMSVYCKDNVDDFKEALKSVTLAQTKKPKQVVIVQDGVVPSAIDEVIEEINNETEGIEITVLKKEKNHIHSL